MFSVHSLRNGRKATLPMALRMEEIHTASLLYPVQNRLNENGRWETGRRIQNIRESPLQGLRAGQGGGGVFPNPPDAHVNTALDLWSALCSAHNLHAPPKILPKYPQVLALPSILSISGTPEALKSTGRPGIAGWHDLPPPGREGCSLGSEADSGRAQLGMQLELCFLRLSASSPSQSPQSHEDQAPPHLPPSQLLFLSWTQMFAMASALYGSLRSSLAPLSAFQAPHTPPHIHPGTTRAYDSPPLGKHETNHETAVSQWLVCGSDCERGGRSQKGKA